MQCRATTKRATRCQNQTQGKARYCRVHGKAAPTPQPQAARQANESPAFAQPDADNPSAAFTSLADLLARAMPTDTAAPAPTAPQPSAADPFAALAAALAAAATTAETQPNLDTAGQPPPAANSPLSQAIYSAAYGVGYGIAFPTFLLMGMLPNNPAGNGMRDGVRAAQDTVSRMGKSKQSKR